jgi:phosphatidylglycerol:prolipoprotein diacylglycerol transferase
MTIGVLSWPVFPRIGGVSPHGVGIAVGFFLGGSLTARFAERKGVSKDDVWNMLMRAVFGVIVGSRLFYVFGHLSSYWPNVVDILKIWEGGLVFYGGVFGGIAFAYPYARKKGFNYWDVMDAAAPGFPLGLLIGRIGDLIVGDHLGGPSTFPLAFRPSSGVPVSDPGWPACLRDQFFRLNDAGIGCHQTALYDFMNVLVLLPVVLLLMRKPRPRGFMIAFTATAYGVGRFFVDFARTGTATYGGLRGTQWISVALILFGIWYTVRRARGDTFAPAPVSLDAESGESVYVDDLQPPEHPLAPPHDKPLENPTHPLSEEHRPLE